MGLWVSELSALIHVIAKSKTFRPEWSGFQEVRIDEIRTLSRPGTLPVLHW
jgi:hypothetical protein